MGMSVDQTPVGPAGVWGRWRRRGRNVGQVIGGCQAVQPGNTPWWLLRWRSVRRPFASATKATGGGRRGQWLDRGGKTGRVGVVTGNNR